MMDTSRFLYVEWMVTFGCNFRCDYCFYGKDNLRMNAYMFRQHGPRPPRNRAEKTLFGLARAVGLFHYADSFKNYPLEKWKTFFSYLATFKRELYLSFTGGEPMLDEKQITAIINHLYQCFDKVIIRFDTNGSIVPKFEGLTSDAIITYNVSYHPKMIDRDTLLRNLDGLNRKGKVHMVNRVFSREEFPAAADEISYFAERGYFVNFNPKSFDMTGWTDDDMAVVRRFRNEISVDYPLLEKNRGRLCSYPTFGFQLLPDGYAWVIPCSPKVVEVVRKPERVHALLSGTPIKCPSKCVCFHQYHWAFDGYDGMDIMGQYVERNRAWREKQRMGEK